jgi:hypothetical protein
MRGLSQSGCPEGGVKENEEKSATDEKRGNPATADVPIDHTTPCTFPIFFGS